MALRQVIILVCQQFRNRRDSPGDDGFAFFSRDSFAEVEDFVLVFDDFRERQDAPSAEHAA